MLRKIVPLGSLSEIRTLRLPSVSLVIGASASGKSAFAEELLHASGLAKVFVATARALDAETRVRIEAHRAARAGQGWRTVEAPRDAARQMAQLDAEEVALLDSATAWLSNTMSDGDDWQAAAETLLEVLTRTEAPVVVVSDEMGAGPPPTDPRDRAFAHALGRLNQQLAAASGLVVSVTAGLPLPLKGRLPAGMI